MTTDSNLEELHDFAKKVGLRRQWFQGDHYDLTERRRKKAVELGATEVTAQEMVKRMIGPRGERMRKILAQP